MTNMPNADQAAYWNDTAGQTWARLQDLLDRQIQPLGLRAISALAPALGEKIADIGCGCGQTTLQLASAVGPDGSVLGLDISQTMLAVAANRLASLGMTQATVALGDAQIHPLGVGTFDAVFSRFGVMFFADPIAAFTNLAGALKPEGRLAFVCWRPLPENLWMTVPMMAAMKHLGSPEAPDTMAPGPFAFSDPDRVRRILDQAGFADILIEPHDQAIGGNDLNGALEVAMHVGPVARVIREKPETSEAVKKSMTEALAGFLQNGLVMMPSATWIVTARKA